MKTRSFHPWRMLLLGTVCSMFLVSQGTASDPKAKTKVEPVDAAMNARIRKEGLNNSQVMKHLFYLTEVSGPRFAGSPNFMKAANWAKDQLTKWGLKKARLEEWGKFGRSWTLEKFTLEMTEPYYAPLIGYPKAWVGSTNGPISAKPIIMTSFTKKDQEKFHGKLKNAIVLIRPKAKIVAKFEPDAKRFTREELIALGNRGNFRRNPNILPKSKQKQLKSNDQPNRADRIRKRRRRFFMRRRLPTAFFKKEGVAAILQPTFKGNDGTVFVSGGGSRKVGDEYGIPAIVMTGEHYNRLYRLTEAGIYVKVNVNVKTRFYENNPMDYNVIAEIPGTDPKLKHEVVMMGAHLDCWHSATGATDNAAGCAVMMEVARILTALKVKPRRTIRIGLWGAEETGLNGSRGYVAKHLKKGTEEHKNFAAYFNFDNGTGKVRGIRTQGNTKVKKIFEAWVKPFADLDANTVSLAYAGGTDHLSFDAVGLPGFGFIQDPIHYSSRTHHSNMDGYDHVVPADLTQAATVITSFVYHAAQRDEKLPRKPERKRRSRKSKKKSAQKKANVKKK